MASSASSGVSVPGTSGCGGAGRWDAMNSGSLWMSSRSSFSVPVDAQRRRRVEEREEQDRQAAELALLRDARARA